MWCGSDPGISGEIRTCSARCQQAHLARPDGLRLMLRWSERLPQAAFKGACLHLGYQMLGTPFTWVTQWVMQRGKKSWPPHRITSGFMLKPAIIHKQDVPLLLYGETINAKRLFSILLLLMWGYSPRFGAFSHSSSWTTSESFCSWGMCSEIPSFGTLEVWSAYVWSLTQMLARCNSLLLLIISSSHLLSTVTSREIDVARD